MIFFQNQNVSIIDRLWFDQKMLCRSHVPLFTRLCVVNQSQKLVDLASHARKDHSNQKSRVLWVQSVCNFLFNQINFRNVNVSYTFAKVFKLVFEKASQFFAGYEERGARQFVLIFVQVTHVSALQSFVTSNAEYLFTSVTPWDDDFENQKFDSV